MSEFMEGKIIGWSDIARGVGEVLVDEAKVGLHWLARQVRHLQHEGLSSHFVRERGSGPALDRELYDQPELPMFYSDVTGQQEVWPVIERPDCAQLDRTAMNRWDSMGDYTERSE